MEANLKDWRKVMNRKVGRDSVEPWNVFGAMNIRARRSLALPREISSNASEKTK